MVVGNHVFVSDNDMGLSNGYPPPLPKITEKRPRNIKAHFPNVALSYKMKKKTKLVNSDHSKMSLYMFRLINHCQNTQPRKKLLIKGFKTITAIKIFIISQIHSPHRISVPREISLLHSRF